MDRRLPDVIQPLLDAYISCLQDALPGYIKGFYVEGSIALDAFNAHYSDIDFIALTNNPPNDTTTQALRDIHARIAAKFPQWQLEGSYMTWEALTKADHSATHYLNHHDGKLETETGYDVNDVPWWVVKNRGIALIGPAPAELPYTVNWEVLVTKMHHNMNTYWRSFVTTPSRMAWLYADYGIAWAVLGVLRQYYTFRENTITSKQGAGEYALKHVPVHWHRIIQEALNIRSKKGKSLYRMRVLRAIEAIRFLRHIIAECSALKQS